MAGENWQKVREIFDSALRCKPEERHQFVHEACGEDKLLLAEVESLLKSLDNANSFMETPAVAKVADLIEVETKKLKMGKHFAHYEIIEQIGAGGMGEVYLAKDKKLDRKVAIKVLNEQFSQHESNLQRFTREAKAASALNHPNILVIHEVGESESEYYIVSEYVEGKTLREIIRKSRLGLLDILDISIQIASALAAAHEAHLVHRDIKPENIMIRHDGFIKVLDFGLAKLVEQKNQSILDLEDKTVQQNQTAKGVILGTVNYMSPEQAKGERVDERTDIFSLGGVFYEMLAGQTPFAGDSTSETFANLINIEPLPLSRFAANIPNELQKIVSKTLRKNADKRYQTIKELVFDLKKAQKRLDFEAETERLETLKKTHSKQPNKSVGLIIDSANIKSGKRRQNKIETQSHPPNNLSRQTARLIGREKEIGEIIELLKRDDVRLVTMTGVGGTGKTRLAKEVALEMLSSFADGVFFVELAALTNAEIITSTIAQTLGLKEAGGKSIVETLKDYLRKKTVLLIVDNFEQVIDAAPQIAELLPDTDKLKILITSRELLRLSVEREFAVPPLALPNNAELVSLDELSKYEAIKLFVERARGAKPNFVLTNENAQSVAEICLRLDGLPLAIELAAARVKILNPQATLAKLEKRLQLLTGGARDLPTRQQTMRNTLKWSYDLLTEEEKRLFRRLSVFAGGFTFEAAEAVCFNNEPNESPIEVLDLVTSLVDKSLLVSKEQQNGSMRFRMLEVVREYALDALEIRGEAEATHRSHAAYFLALGEEANLHLQDEKSVEWLDSLEAEHDNLRAALQWSLENDIETATHLAAAIRFYWIFHAHLTEGCQWLKTALGQTGNSPTDVRIKLLNGIGVIARNQGDYETARRMHEAVLAHDQAEGDEKESILSLRSLGALAVRQSSFTEARIFLEKALTTSRVLNDKSEIAYSLSYLGNLFRTEGDNASAYMLFAESLAIFRQLNNKEAVSADLNSLGFVDYEEGNYETARSYFAEGLVLTQKLKDKIGISYFLDGFAALALQSGELQSAIQLAGASEHLRESIGYEIDLVDCRFRETYLSELKTKMDTADVAKFYEQGCKMKLEEAIALCLKKDSRKIN